MILDFLKKNWGTSDLVDVEVVDSTAVKIEFRKIEFDKIKNNLNITLHHNFRKCVLASCI
jgi:hypothetical protein